MNAIPKVRLADGRTMTLFPTLAAPRSWACSIWDFSPRLLQNAIRKGTQVTLIEGETETLLTWAGKNEDAIWFRSSDRTSKVSFLLD